MKYWLLGSVGCVLLALGVGCGGDDEPKHAAPKGGSGGVAGQSQNEGGTHDDDDDDDDDAPTQGGAPDSGGTGNVGGKSGDAAGGAAPGGTGGGGSPSVTFESRPAGIELELDLASKLDGFSLSTSSIKQKTGGALNYSEWLAELVNGTQVTQCLIAITADFQDATGATVTKYETFAAGPAYDMGSSKLSSPCVAPGERVPVWANDLPEAAIAIDKITKLVVNIESFPTPDAVPHPMSPTIAGVKQTYSDTFEEWAIAGTATSTADVYNVTVTFWGKDGAFYVDSETDYHLEDFLEGETWAIDTSPLGLETVTLTKVVPYFSFIEGTKSALRVRFDDATRKVIERRGDWTRTFDAARMRRERFREVSR